MVRTMHPLLALRRTARMIRLTAPLSDGLPADEEVLLDAPEPWLAPALVAAGTGVYEDAAKLLATTRERAEWETRDRCVARLAAFADARPEWFAHWQEAAPHDPDMLLVKAELALRRGWASPARADLLRGASPLIAAAAEGDASDPVPWRVALDQARGTNASHTVFENLWEQAVRRSSHHYGCHLAALEYLSAAWYGSHRECFDFAERAAEDALPDSLLQTLPLRAAYMWLTAEEGGTPRGPRAAAVARERLDAAADRALALSARYPQGDPWPAEARNLLVYVLLRLERWTQALQELRRVGPLATSTPWAALSDDPLAQFLDVRDGVRIEVAALTPVGRGRRRDRTG
ncbi:hypothetical protein [Streptomyces sp. NPDC007088]|uniref:hypothetical protein n=1 Tax=Streptomyces sp. NPDC007088 TaxID=3364773 RepID=UPI00369439DC